MVRQGDEPVRTDEGVGLAQRNRAGTAMATPAQFNAHIAGEESTASTAPGKITA